MKILWREDKLKAGMIFAWLLTVFFSFCGDAVFSVHLSVIGAVFPFRILLPITAVLYVLWTAHNKTNPWKDSGRIEKLCWLLAAIMLLHSLISLPSAIDFSFSFRRLFNLCFDLTFFYLAMRLCRERKVLCYTVICASLSIFILCIAGSYEMFNGGIFNDAYNQFKRFEFFYAILQFPVVTYSNTNDFASSLVFTLAAVLLFWGKWHIHGKKHVWLLLVLIPLCFFMALASSARLVIVTMWLLLGGLLLFFLLADRKRLLIPVVILLAFFGCNFANQYRYTVPAVKNYVQNMSIYLSQIIQQGNGGSGSQDMPLITMPSFEMNTPSDMPLEDELFEIDPETGEKIFNQTTSGGVRLRLLKHTLECFIDSKGMGVGIGNTEQLAKEKFANEPKSTWNIHCFPARIIADYGIWVLIPLCLIVYCLITRGIKAIISGIKRKESGNCAMGVLYLTALLAYPILSTASSDAQDLLAMWLYLACIVIVGNHLTDKDLSKISNSPIQ